MCSEGRAFTINEVLDTLRLFRADVSNTCDAVNLGELTCAQDLRLEQRFVDLRTPANQAIFRLQSAVCQVCLS